ncbi:MAG TPA: hypothetical protein VNL71_06555 [Chloroflexota bacterium]|nr:hypothetical protein [Chloroflexota bacterium]
MRYIRFLLLPLLAIGLLIQPLAGGRAAHAATPVVTVTPSTIAENGSFSLSGTGFPAAETLVAHLDSTTLAPAMVTNSLGALGPYTFALPTGIAGGAHQVTVATTTGQALAAATIQVVNQTATLALSPTTGAPGMHVVASASGFSANEQVLFTDGGVTVGAGTANTLGQVTISLVLPQHMAVGAASLVATGSVSRRVADAAYLVNAASVALSAASGAAGTPLTVTGHNFAATETVRIALNGVTITQASTDSSGAFSAAFPIPAGPAGATVVTVTGVNSLIAVNTPFTRSGVVIQANVSTQAAGGAVTLTGSGFLANEVIQITIPGQALQTLPATAQGTFSIALTIPASQAAGSLVITASGESSHLSNTVAVTVTVAPKIVLSASAVAAGGSFTITGSGFGANEVVTLTLANVKAKQETANAQGNFTGTITLSEADAAATTEVVATGVQTHRVASAALSITAPLGRITVSSSTALAGSSLTVSGANFIPGEQVLISASQHGLLTVTADSNGAFANARITLPATLAVGAQTIEATGVSSHRVAKLAITVQARPAAALTISPADAILGAPVTINGSGFTPGEVVTLATSAGTSFATATANAQGSFSLTTVLPTTLGLGNGRVEATGATSHQAVAAAVNVLAPRTVTTSSATWYFASGQTTGGTDETIAVLNPNGQAVQGTLTLYYGAGQTREIPFGLAARARGTYDVGQLAGAMAHVAVGVHANLPIAATRISSLNGNDRMGSTGVSAPSRSWYMAEGYTGLSFVETLSLLNPGSVPANVHISWPLGNGRAPIQHTLTVPARTQMTVSVNTYVPRASHATMITSDQPIVAARGLVFGAAGQGATLKPGITQAAGTLYFAEGSTANGFEEYLTIFNPDATRAAQVTAQFYDPQGHLVGTRTVMVGAMARGTIKVNTVARESSIASVLHSTLPIVAERSLYFGAPNGGSAGGTDVFGRSTPALAWAFAAGDTRQGQAEFDLVYNPNPKANQILATYHGSDGQLVRKIVDVPANARVTVDVIRSVTGLARGYHGVTLRSLSGLPFLAEQAIYNQGLTRGFATAGTPAS